MAFLPAYAHWLRGEVEETLREVETVTSTIPSRKNGPREQAALARPQFYLQFAGSFYLALGQLDKAEELFNAIPSFRWRPGNRNTPTDRLLYKGWVARIRDDEQGLHETMTAYIDLARTAGYTRHLATYLGGFVLGCRCQPTLKTRRSMNANWCQVSWPFDDFHST